MKFIKVILFALLPIFVLAQNPKAGNPRAGKDTLRIKGHGVIIITQEEQDSAIGKDDTIPTILGPTETKLTFTTPTFSETSLVGAGLYRGDQLVRTLIGNGTYSSGSHNLEFVPIDDNGDTITDLSGMHLEVTRSNTTYDWELACNTSTVNSGDNLHQGFQQIKGIAVTASKVYYNKGYGEGTMPYNYVTLDAIQTRNKLFPTENGRNNVVIADMCTDGTYVYWAGNDPFAGRKPYRYASLVFATKVSDDTEVTFTDGTPYQSALGRYFKSTLGLSHDSTAPITGVAVQQAGNFLFLARTSHIVVFNKTTGDSITTNTLTCGRIATDGTSTLWVEDGTTVKKYSVSVGGVLTLSDTFTGFSNPAAMTVNGDTLVVADGGASQQVKAYNKTDGSLYWALGTYGGYYKSSLATNYKFYFDDDSTFHAASIGYASDGSMWLVDGGNCRLIHFSAGRIYLEHIQYIPNSYNVYCDPNDPTRLFSDYMEFTIDYSKPLQSGNGSWTFKANWQNDPFVLQNFSNTFTIRPIKLSNGRTYTLVPDNYGITYAGNFRYQVLELVGDSLRQTGQYIQPYATGYLHHDGDLYYLPRKVIGKPMVYFKRKLTGFTGNNPVWGSDSIIATINYHTGDPYYSGNARTLRPGEKTSDNKLLVFEGSSSYPGYHLGGLGYGDTSFSWKSGRATHDEYTGNFPWDGAYDIGNTVQYAGAVALALDDNIIWGYHGEFWKGGQTNKWNHLAKNGLVVGQFGVTGSDIRGSSVAQMAGNVSSASLVKVGDTLYLWHNDEGHHSGVHRWAIRNYNSVITDTVAAALTLVPIDATITNLMDSIPFNAVLNNGVGGWYRTPTAENYTDRLRNYWSVKTSVKSYDKLAIPDIYLNFRSNIYGSSTVYRTLPTTNQSTWALSGELTFDGNIPSVDYIKSDTSGSGALFVDVVDYDNKVIVRLFSKYNDATKTFVDYYANNQLLWRDSAFTSILTAKYWQDFSVTNTSGTLGISYAGHSISGLATLDATANKSRPDKLRIYMWSKAANNARCIGIKDLIFDK